MKFLFCFLLTIAALGHQCAYGQKHSSIPISIYPIINQEKLILNKVYTLGKNNTITIENLRFYISNIQLLQNDGVVWQEKNSFHLYNQEDSLSLLVDLNISKKITYNKIRFCLGIDSLTNVSGAMGGDLDPTKGMYWTWQSGYINFKLEGRSNICPTKNNEFQFHLGGYQAPFNNLQTITLSIQPSKPIIILLDIQKIIESINLEAQNHIMSPCTDAVELSSSLASCFKIMTP